MNELRSKFQQACISFQEATARQFLVEFPNYLEALSVCREILQWPFTPENEFCQFQATVALRQAAVVRWNSLEEKEQEQLLSFVVQTVINLSKAVDYKCVLLKSLSGVSAVLLKLAWKSVSFRDDFLKGIAKLVNTGCNENERSAGLLLLNAIVEEFSLHMCSALNLSVRYHKECSLDFQKQYLRKAFVDCLDVCRLSPKIGSSVLCFLSATTMNSILMWDFSQGSQLGDKRRRKDEETELRSELTVMSIKPEESWCNIFTDTRTFSWILPLLQIVSSAGAGQESALLAQELQQLLVTLCSVNARTFPKTVEGREQHHTYLCNVMKELMQLLDAHTSGGVQFHDNLLTALKGFDALSKNVTVGELLQTSRELTESLRILELINALTLSALIQGGLSLKMVGTNEQECCSLLLKIWARFCTPQVENIYGGVLDVKVNEDVKQFTHPVFEQLVASGLNAAEEDDFANEITSDESFSGDGEEALITYATIGRCAAPRSLQLLGNLLKEAQQRVLQSVETANSVPETQLERIAFLIQLAGSVASDDVLGEDPSIPPELAEISRDAPSADDDPVVGLGCCILEVSSLILLDSVKSHLSVRTTECCLHALACWAETYLLMGYQTTPNLQQCFGNNERGSNVLQAVVSICNTCLTTFSTEETIEKLVCDRIFKSLTKSSESKKQLTKCSAWLELHTSFAALYPVFQRLNHKMLNHISNALCLVAGGFANEKERTAYLMALLNPLANEIQAIVAEKHGTVPHVGVVLEIMRGIAKSTREIPDSQQLLFSFFEAAMDPLLKLLNMLNVDANVICSVLKLAAEVVEANIVFLEEPEAKKLCLWSLEVIRVFSKNHAGVKDLKVSQSLQEQKMYEHCRNIQAMLKLLKNLTDWDFLSETKPRQVDIAAVVIEGLTLVISMMSEDMLKFPKLSFRYFDLLAYLCEVYPEKIAQLQSFHLQTLLSTLDSGLRLEEMRSLRIALEALEGLAKYHWNQCKGSENGITFCEEQSSTGFAAHYVTILFQRLIQGQEGEDAVVACTMSVLLLFLSDAQAVSEALLSSLTAAFPHHNMEKELNTLFTLSNEENPISSKSEDLFRKNMFSFVKRMREMVRLY